MSELVAAGESLEQVLTPRQLEAYITEYSLAKGYILNTDLANYVLLVLH